MDPNDINQTEWENSGNWSGPKWASVYFSKRDTRTVVPKQLPWMGWTVNLGKAAGVFTLMGVLVGIPLLVIVIVLLTEGGR
jgi:uncharacterized membrane protein